MWRNLRQTNQPKWNHFGFSIAEMKDLYEMGYDDAEKHQNEIPLTTKTIEEHDDSATGNLGVSSP